MKDWQRELLVLYIEGFSLRLNEKLALLCVPELGKHHTLPSDKELKIGRFALV